MRHPTVTVLIVDDHPVVAQGVGLLLRPVRGIEAIGSAATGRDALAAAARLRPDVMLLDLRLPDMQAVEVIRALRSAGSRCQVLVFTAHAEHSALAAAIDEGAGCLLKDVSTSDLCVAIRQAASGETPIDGRIEGDPGGRLRAALGRAGVTRREYEVLRLVAAGQTNPEIAAELGLTRNTVKAYLQNAMGKLGARNRVEAVARAGELQLL